MYKDDDMLTLAQAAEVVDFAAHTLRAFCATGELPAEEIPMGKTRLWRVKYSDLIAFTAKHDAEKKVSGRPRRGKLGS